MSFSVEDVQRREFGNAPIGRRGYAKNEVDAFVRRVARTLAGEDDLTASEVHHVLFGRPLLGKRGYDEREVDEFLDAVEDQLAERTGRPHALPKAREHSESTDPRATAPAEAPTTSADTPADH
jgi:DivIVA domain-containing protein